MAGKAILTVENPEGDHVTFRIAAPSEGNKINRESPVRFVGVMTGSDNEAHYSYIGMLDKVNGVKPTKASKIPLDDVRAAAAAWAIRQCIKGATIPPGYKIRHSGCCLRCGRTLTNPDSLDVMYGPECAEKI
jgi:hypothetical protein